VTSTRCSTHCVVFLLTVSTMLALSTTQALTLVDSVLKESPIINNFWQPFPSLQPPVSGRKTMLSFSSLSQTLFSNTHPQARTTSEIYSSRDTITSLTAKDIAMPSFLASRIISMFSNAGQVQGRSHRPLPLTSLLLMHSRYQMTRRSCLHIFVGSAFHNLSLGSHTSSRVTTVLGADYNMRISPAFANAYSLGQGKQTLIYDTTRPSGPVKVIPMIDSANSGDIVAVLAAHSLDTDSRCY